MLEERIVPQEKDAVRLKHHALESAPEEGRDLEKEKNKYIRSRSTWRREKWSCAVSLISFAVYMIVGGILYRSPGDEIAANAVMAVSGLGMIQHWILVLIKINQDPISSRKKLLSYLGVVVFAAIGAWAYTLGVSRKLNLGRQVAV